MPNVGPKSSPAATEVQKAELDQRLADHERDPDELVAWSEVEADADACISA